MDEVEENRQTVEAFLTTLETLAPSILRNLDSAIAAAVATDEWLRVQVLRAPLQTSSFPRRRESRAI
jgi:hypothetical protein